MTSDALWTRCFLGVHPPQRHSDIMLHDADHMFITDDVAVLRCQAVVNTSRLANLEPGVEHIAEPCDTSSELLSIGNGSPSHITAA